MRAVGISIVTFALWGCALSGAVFGEDASVAVDYVMTSHIGPEDKPLPAAVLGTSLRRVDQLCKTRFEKCWSVVFASDEWPSILDYVVRNTGLPREWKKGDMPDYGSFEVVWTVKGKNAKGLVLADGACMYFSRLGLLPAVKRSGTLTNYISNVAGRIGCVDGHSSASNADR